MDRREFLQGVAASAAGLTAGPGGQAETSAEAQGFAARAAKPVSVEGHTFLAEFDRGPVHWKVYEDLQTREGAIVFISSDGQSRVLPKTAEASSAEGVTPYLGLSMDEIAGTLPDLLAQRLLEGGGDPDPERVKSVVPPISQSPSSYTQQNFWQNGTFIGTKECCDTQAIHYDGSTETFIAIQYAPEIASVAAKRQVQDGLMGGWLPVIRKVFPLEGGAYWEITGFPDVEKREKFIVHTWHRVARVEGGKISKVFYRHTYRAYPPRRKDPTAEEFYRALLVSAEYWEANLREFAPAALPQNDWVDMAKHAFVRELMTRPGGAYPKYGVLERVYGGSEHDGFQDTFTHSVYANLEWGRFSMTKAVIESYFDDFVDSQGIINVRGIETGHYGLMLSLLARYYNYTRDRSLLLKYRAKLQAIAGLLMELHDASLQLPKEDEGYGLIHGWSEADACMRPDPDRSWRPFFGNSAMASRGFTDLGRVWIELARATGQTKLKEHGQELLRRSQALREAVVPALRKTIRKDMTPPYAAPLPGMEHIFEEDERKDHDGPQGDQQPLRSYMEMLHADVLPADLTDLVINCIAAYGGTTLGIPSIPEARGKERKAKDRRILGFPSYEYAQTLLRRDRIEEFLLFLYAHRYHCHTRGHWTAAESASIAPEPRRVVCPYCTPAQQVIPMLIRWMLVFEDSNEDRLYLGRGLPRAWVASGRDIRIKQAPTRWGKMDFSMKGSSDKKTILARVQLARGAAPAALHITMRVPPECQLNSVTVNGQTAVFSGPRKDTVVIEPGNERAFEVVAHLG